MKYRYQAGISVPQVLVVLAIVLILATTFMGVVQFQLQRAKFEQATITAGYVAEIGFQQMRADLARANGDWRQVPGIVSDCSATNPNRARCQRVPQTSDFPAFRRVRENPADPNSPVIGIYEALVETGERRALFGNKTITGSATGFVPGSALPTQKVGYDVYGNELCGGTITDSACPGRFVGVRVTAWLTDRSGNIPPKTRSQTVYGVLELGAGIGEDAPSGYLLDVDDEVIIRPNTEPNFSINPPSRTPGILTSGLFGPIHTNKGYKFVWDSLRNGEIIKDPTNIDHAPNPLNYPILKIDTGKSFYPFEPTSYDLKNPLTGTDILVADRSFQIAPPGYWWRIAWGSTHKPANGSGYPVTTNGGPSSAIKRSSPNYEYIFSNFQAPTVGGGYIPSSVETQEAIDWNPSKPKPDPGDKFYIRYISHDKIHIFDKLTYFDDLPVYRYRHEHAQQHNGDYGNLLYQIAHQHTNFLSATADDAQVDLGPTSISCSGGGTWPTCYDSTKWLHTHPITTDIFAASAGQAHQSFFELEPDAGRPVKSANRHTIPLLKPLAAGAPNGPQNYLNQLEQLNKYLQLTLGMSMPRNEDGSLNPTTIPGKPANESEENEQYGMGYIAGDMTKNYPDAGAVADFRAVYFGSKLKYSAGANAGNDVIAEGSPISDTETIWVNDTPSSSGYMLVANSKLSTDYHRYTYKQIPPSQLILVRDKVVLIGNYRPATSDCSSLDAGCAPTTTALDLGNATIVDGRLTIVSFTTTPPSNYANYNKGDIVVVGNVVYRNRFYQNPNALNESRQYDPQPVAPYSSATPSSINDPSIMWVTNVDGTLSRDGEGESVGRHNSLGLYASNDVKIAVNAYFYGPGSTVPSEDTVPAAPAYEQVRIMGQLVAGNKITVSAKRSGAFLSKDDWDNNPVFSDRDELRFFGSLYSREIPNFGSYFRRYRFNHYDKSLFVNPLIGAPYYPKVDGDYRNQSIFNNFPKLVNGSWQAGR